MITTNTERVQKITPLPGISADLLRTLAYFDLFHYPLRRDEIGVFTGRRLPSEQLDQALTRLQAEGVIHFSHGFYSLHRNPLPTYRRRQGNQRAEKLLPMAQWIGRFLFRFPFVRGVGISGSLSKNFADAAADMDFFIITKRNRLWIARTIMHLFKKLSFFFGKQHCFCMNYYVDEEALIITDRNIFTAIEIKTLLPVAGAASLRDFFAANSWTNELLPACPFRELPRESSVSFPKKVIEWILSGGLGDRLDDFLWKRTDKRWKRKQRRGERNEKGVCMGLDTEKHFARSNPGSFQEKVLTLYRERLESLGIETGPGDYGK